VQGGPRPRVSLLIPARNEEVNIVTRSAQRAQDERTWRSLHVQYSRLFRFPDLVRAEMVAIAPERSSLAIDSRARFGWWDFGVNRRRVLRWVHDLQQVIPNHGAA
jgi:uncharacterized protein (DUF1499 family)